MCASCIALSVRIKETDHKLCCVNTTQCEKQSRCSDRKDLLLMLFELFVTNQNGKCQHEAGVEGEKQPQCSLCFSKMMTVIFFS